MDMPHSTYNMTRGMEQTSVSERAMKLSLACNSTFALASVANHSIDEHICMHHARTISGSLEWPADPPFELILWNSFRQVLEI